MDLTAVSKHSRGRLERGTQLDDFLSFATVSFKTLVPELFKHGFYLAIATHSDEAEFVTGRQASMINPNTHILGKELASKLIEKYFTNDIVSSFFIVAYNPRAHHHRQEEEEEQEQENNEEENINKMKRYHFRLIRNHFSDVESKEILFFDDTEDIVRDCNEFCNINAFQVDPNFGFRLEDITKNILP